MTKKQAIKSVVTLLVICLVVAALLAIVNSFTNPVISDRNAQGVADSLGKVMKDGEFDTAPDKLSNDAPETIREVYTEKTGKGTVVVLLTNKGYTGKNIGITVGIDTDGKIVGMLVTQNEESIVPEELKPGGSYGNHYVGAEAGDIAELTTGATVSITEGAIKSALNDAFVYLGFAKTLPELPRDESEIEERAKALYGNQSKNLVSITPEDTTYVKRVYKERESAQYVAYAFAYSRYGTPEFEFLVYVDESGTVKAVDKILWKVSDPKPEWGYIPPTEQEVNIFFESFVGKNANDVLSVDAASGATNTSGRVKDAAFETLSVKIVEVDYTARIIGIVLLALSVCSIVAYTVITRKRRGEK